MCVVSMVGEHFIEKWERGTGLPIDVTQHPPFTLNVKSEISRKEFDELKREVQELKALLVRAKKYDEENGEPDCEMDEKMRILKEVAKLVGVDLDDVLAKG